MLYKQLAEIQRALKAPKGQFNAFGKYAYRSCEDILEAVKPLLNGLVLTISDELLLIGNRYYVKAIATLTDGETTLAVPAYAREEEDKKGMDGSQITGAASSYARKYALNGLFLIDDTKDADTQDNSKGNGTQSHEVAPKAMSKQMPPKAEPAPQTQPPAGTVEPQKHDGLDQKQQQAKIAEWLLTMCGSENAAQAKLEELTTWKNGKGETVKGKTNPFQLNTKPNAKGATQTSVTYTQVRKLYEEFQEAM